MKKPVVPYMPMTGTALPLAALKTQDSCGVGEFLDLIPFADFCKKADLEIIQLLPVNDTGTESSPYSALSAFALHPLYIRLQALPEADSFKKEIEMLKKNHQDAKRFDYAVLRKEKLQLLRYMYGSAKKSIVKDAALKQWIKDNPWIAVYAVFMEIKNNNNEASWKEWPKSLHLSLEQITAEWNTAEKREDYYFYAWLQMRLDQQFTLAVDYLKSQQIILKGDIPIMMNEDSCDIWAYPDFFIDNLRAGAPPDGFNPYGQNWGFPIYNWDNLKKDGYSWWKNRLVHASKYYQAYRIDHILGFFRIWAVPFAENTAVLGHTMPYKPITADELEKAGFAPPRIRWLTQPHVPTRTIEEVNNYDYLGTHGLLAKIMNRIENEEMWLFKDSVKGEKDIYAADLPDPVKNKLAECWRDRTFVTLAPGKFTPTWTYKDTTAWKSLSRNEQSALHTLFTINNNEMEKLWEEQAQTILGELTKEVNMIACAEDLGANLQCLPKVLEQLSILRLCIIRWYRSWEKPKQPFIPLKAYPPLSVTANSVHDSSTNRLWWLTESDDKAFIEMAGTKAQISPESFTPKTAAYILETAAASASVFCIHPIQDILHLDSEYYDSNPESERVNIPGTVTSFNWTYRLPTTIKNLIQNDSLTEKIKKISLKHKRNTK